MSNTSDELSPEEQNVSNQSLENVDSALASFLRKPQETYEDFVSSFIYLKLEDIEKAKNKSKPVITNPSESKTSSQTTFDLKTTSENDHKPDTEELEEEILDDITCEVLESSESESKNCAKKKFTQFDNFLNDDGDTSDDERYNVTSSEYLASFDTDSSPAVDQQAKKCDKNETYEEKSSPENVLHSKSSKVDVEQTSMCESVLDSDFSPYQPDENGFLLNPGEFDEDFHKTNSAVVSNVTCLEYSTISSVPTVDKSCTEITETETVVENDSSDVIPFVLDDDFDYDNVVLSPKFTAAEMEYLNNIERFTEDSS